MKSIIALCWWGFAALAAVPAAVQALEPSSDDASPAKVTIHIVDSSQHYPPTADFLTLHSGGSLTIFGGHGTPLSDEKLAELLRGGWAEKRPDKTYFRLLIAKETTVSVEELGAALQHMRELADPQVEVIVFVCLNKLKKIEKAP